jgi:hypothetical protein
LASLSPADGYVVSGGRYWQTPPVHFTDREIRKAAREVAEEIAAMPSAETETDGILAWLIERTSL